MQTTHATEAKRPKTVLVRFVFDDGVIWRAMPTNACLFDIAETLAQIEPHRSAHPVAIDVILSARRSGRDVSTPIPAPC